MALLRRHPEVATRSCAHCQKWRYDEATGRVAEDAFGQKIPRYNGERLPCHFTPSTCPKGTPDAGIELSDINWQVYLHNRECAAVGDFPNDEVVRRNAAIIFEVEQQIRDQMQWQFLKTLVLAGR